MENLHNLLKDREDEIERCTFELERKEKALEDKFDVLNVDWQKKINDLKERIKKSNKKIGNIRDKLREQTVNTQVQLEALEESVLDEAKKIKVINKQLSNLSADIAGAGTSGGNRSKMPNPPIFSGSNDKGDVTDWVRQIKLYTKHMAIITDTQQIVYALSRICAPAAK